jgi:aminomethyltransferase
MEPIAAEAITSDTHAGPFHAVQTAAGASFYEDWGALWTQGFGSPDDEYWSIRLDAALWDVSSLVKYHFVGRDALAALDRLSTRRVIDATPGTIRYCVVLDDRGRMLDEGTIFVIGPEEAYLLGNDPRPPFIHHMREHTRDLDVSIENVTRSIPNVAVQGPLSYELLAKLTSVDFAELRWFHLIPERVEIAGVPSLIARTGFTGELGYELYLLDEGAGAEALWDAVVELGATPVGLDAIEMVRVEAGLVICEEDYQPGETDPYELNMEAFIDLGHDFVGRAACLSKAGAPPRRLVTLRFDEPNVPKPGSVVVAEGEDVGDVRSAQGTPRFGAIALAVVRAPYSQVGVRVTVDGWEATVHGVPIDDPAKTRPRSDPLRPVVADFTPVPRPAR